MTIRTTLTRRVASLLGGAVLAIGLADGADAQCTVIPGDRISPSVLPMEYDDVIQERFDHFTLSGGKLYTVEYGRGLNAQGFEYEESLFRTWDVSDPNNAVMLTESSHSSWAFRNDSPSDKDMFVIGNTLIGRNSGAVLGFYDISDPNNAIYASTLNLLSAIESLFEHDGLMYVWLGFPDRLVVIDASDPFAPQTIGSFNFGTTNSVNGGQPANGRAPYAQTNGGVWNVGLLDISDPSNILASETATGTGIGDPRPSIVGDTVAVLSTQGTNILELWAFDFSDPRAPVRLADPPNPSPDHINSAFGAGLHWYLVDSRDVVWVIDMLDPSVPFVAASHDDLGGEFVDFDGGVIAAVDRGDQGRDLRLFDVSDCTLLPVVLTSPVSRLADAGGPAEQFTVTAMDAVWYQWMFDGQMIIDGGAFSGAATPTLTVAPTEQTEGVYTCIVSTPDGSESTLPAFLGVRAVPSGCLGDINGDGTTNVFDFADFVADYGCVTPE